jgi:hypothetical protein
MAQTPQKRREISQKKADCFPDHRFLAFAFVS